MKVAALIVRILMGLMFLFSSITVLFHLMPQPEPQGDVKTFMSGLMVTRYFFPLLKITELLCGLAFITNRFATLAVVVIFPVIVNILLFHLYVNHEGLIVAVLLFLGDLFLAYYYRENYRSLFRVK